MDMAMELFSLKNKFDEQTKELRSVKREGEAKERDFKVRQSRQDSTNMKSVACQQECVRESCVAKAAIISNTTQ